MPTTSTQPELREAVQRLTRDLVKAAATLSVNEVRYIVDAYYTIQDNRKATANQIRALSEAKEPHDLIGWLLEQNEILEQQIQRALGSWTDARPAARWSKSIVGIGPIISAGLAAHIDLTKCQTVGDIWAFAGLDPTRSWNKGEKRPWNAGLKCLCWKIGESFVKVSSHASDFYGQRYVSRKRLEWERNLSGALSDQARATLERKKFGSDRQATKWYGGKLDPAVVRQFLTEGKSMLEVPLAANASGVPMLPPAHIHARAKRWAVKLFLSHYFEVATRLEGREPVKPFAISILNHAHYIAPPNYPMAA